MKFFPAEPFATNYLNRIDFSNPLGSLVVKNII